MTVKQLSEILSAKLWTAGCADQEISCGMTCDVLSRVMVKGRRGMAWITVQANMNALAVAVMVDAACLIFPECATPGEDVIERAQKEGVALMTAEAGSFELAGKLYAAGLRGEE